VDFAVVVDMVVDVFVHVIVNVNGFSLLHNKQDLTD
jgi:hypothetical protein